MSGYSETVLAKLEFLPEIRWSCVGCKGQFVRLPSVDATMDQVGAAESCLPRGSQGTGGGGYELGSRVKVLRLCIWEKESKARVLELSQRSECKGSKDWIRTDVSPRGGWQKQSEQDKQKGQYGWGDRRDWEEGIAFVPVPSPHSGQGPPCSCLIFQGQRLLLGRDTGGDNLVSPLSCDSLKFLY